MHEMSRDVWLGAAFKLHWLLQADPTTVGRACVCLLLGQAPPFTNKLLAAFKSILRLTPLDFILILRRIVLWITPHVEGKGVESAMDGRIINIWLRQVFIPAPYTVLSSNFLHLAFFTLTISRLVGPRVPVSK